MWIWSRRPNTGKTTVAMQLRDSINTVTLIHANISRQDDFRGLVGTKLLILD